MKTHKCAAKGCKIDVPQSQLMCAHHWRGLPDDIRADVLSSWRQRRMSDPDTVDAHLAACRRAMKFYIQQSAYASMSGQKNEPETSQKNVEKYSAARPPS